MIIGIDGRALQGTLTGVGRYVVELCRSLDRLLPDASFIIYSNKPVTLPVVSERWKLRLDDRFLSRRLKANAWLKLRCGKLIHEDGVKLFWATAPLLPRLRSEVRCVMTIYDLNFLLVPHTMIASHLLAIRLFFRKDLTRANALVAISKGTADRIFQHFGREVDAVVRPAVSSAFSPRGEAEVKACLDKYGIDAPYLLVVATWEPRKNLELLIQVFLKLRDEARTAGRKLVLVGGKGWKDHKLTKLVNDRQNCDILPLGYVPDEDLPALYTGADAFVFPSIYEGFGMPVLEASACGTRAVASDIPEIREAGGTESIYIKPTFDDLTAGILRALQPPRPKVTLRQQTWDESAEILADILERLSC